MAAVTGTNLLLTRLRSWAGRDPSTGPSDGELLARFAAGDAGALEILVARHGSLVLGTCHRIVGDAASAEDAFQATFLALARRAPALHGRGSLAGWLHTVARHLALRSRATAARFRAPAADPAASGADPLAEMTARELLTALDEELGRLPERLRTPLVLCYLEGRTRDQAARLLGLTPSVVKGRLERGRLRLRARLARRGLELAAVLLAASTCASPAPGAVVPAALAAAATRRAAAFALSDVSTGDIPAHLEVLARAGLPRRVPAAAKVALALALTVGAAAAGIVALSGQTPPPRPDVAQPAAREAARLDRFDDLLPADALARLGTTRLRHSFTVFGIHFSRDGKQLATTGGNSIGRRLCVWDVASGRELHDFEPKGDVFGAAFGPDNKTLAAATRKGVVLYDVATGKELAHFADNLEFECIAYSPDGKVLATGESDGAVRFWDLAGHEIQSFRGNEKRVRWLAFAPDGAALAVVNDDGSVRLLDAATGKERWRVAGHTGGAYGVAFAPDGRSLASCGADDRVRLWDAATGAAVRDLGEGAGHGISSVAFAPDGKSLAWCRADRFVFLSDPTTGKEIRHWQAFSGFVRSLAFSPDGKTLATGAGWGSAVRLWDPATGQALRPIEEGHTGLVSLLAFASNGKTLVSFGRDHVLFRWDVQTGKARVQFREPGQGIPFDAVALAPDLRTLAIGGNEDGRIRLWDVETGKELATFAHPGGVGALAFSPNGKLLVSGGKELVIRLWDVASRKEVNQLTGLTDGVGSLTFSPDGRKLASGTYGNRRPEGPRIRLWDVASAKHLRSIGEPGWGTQLAFSPDGRLLAAASGFERWTTFGDCKVHVWDATTGAELWQAAGHDEGVNCVAFSPDGRFLATGGAERDDEVRLWEADTGRPAGKFTGHHSSISCLAFSPDGRALASGAGDTTILIWDLVGRSTGGTLSPAQLSSAREALRGVDAIAAQRAVRALAGSPAQAVPFLTARLKPAGPPDSARIARLIANLDADAFAEREQAAKELEGLADAAVPALKKLLERDLTSEVRRRVRLLLKQIAISPDWLQARRAVQALEYAATPEARQSLEALAGGDEGARLTAEAKSAVGRLKAH